MSRRWPAEVQNRFHSSGVTRRTSCCGKKMLGCAVFWPLTEFLFHSSHQRMHVRFKRLRPVEIYKRCRLR